MNKPIRNVSLAVIVMIVALLANATYVQVFKADALKTDPRNNRVLLDEYSRQRGLITTSDGTVIALSVPIDSRLKFLRQYPREGAEAFAPVTGYYSFQYLASQIEHYENSILNGSDDRLFGQRFMDMFSGRDPPRRQRGHDDQPEGPAGRVPRHAQRAVRRTVPRLRRGAAAQHRQDPGDGLDPPEL